MALGGSAFAAPAANPADTTATPSEQRTNVFQRFSAAMSERAFMRPVVRLFLDGRYAEAEKVLRRLAEKFPDSALYRYNLAAALARQDKKGEAIDSLAEAVERGFRSASIVERDADFDSLRDDSRFRRLLADLKEGEAGAKPAPAARVRPARIEGRRAPVDEANTGWEPRNNVLVAGFEFQPTPPSDTVHSGDGPVAERLNAWFAKGEAAGNHGDLYDNRDRGHSRLSRELLPQVTHIEYGAAARAVNIDYGVNTGILFNRITFGNSSTALKHRFAWRSQARLILTEPELVAKAYLQYLNSHLYVYPEHRDHDRKHGDLLPANTPYMIVSQGSSGSDKPFLHAVGAILGAFRPEVKQFLRANNLLMPTVQMVLRKSRKPVRGDADYLSAKAHPSVFAAKDIDLERAVELAHGLAAGDIPPMVRLAVEEESAGRAGVDYFAPSGMGEALFDTPGAIARLVRSTQYVKRLVVSAAATKDPNGRPLRFRWVVLRGDADRITIEPRDETGATVEIRIPWHERRPVPDAPELGSDRVDIGAFAGNGVQISAPAFVTLFYPGDQKRLYDESGRIRCIDYNDPEFRTRYVDPLLFPARDWRDCYEYDESGGLIGWNRISGSAVERFTRDGDKVIEIDDLGRPIVGERVGYEMVPTKAGRPRIVAVPTGERVRLR